MERLERLKRGAVICLVAAILAGSSLVRAQDAAKPFLGSWKGTLALAGVELEIRIEFSLDESKKIEGTFDSITQGGYGVKLGDIKIDGRAISFVIDDPNAPGDPTFKGAVDDAGTKISGAFNQSGYTGTFTVAKEKPRHAAQSPATSRGR